MTPDVETLADHFIQMGRQEVMDGMPEGRDAALAELRFADSLRRSAERLSQRSAESARQQGASWREIGEAVGGITPAGCRAPVQRGGQGAPVKGVQGGVGVEGSSSHPPGGAVRGPLLRVRAGLTDGATESDDGRRMCRRRELVAGSQEPAARR